MVRADAPCRSLLPGLALALAAAACARPSAPTAAPPSNTPAPAVADAPVAAAMTGSYSAPHAVMMVCDGGDDGWCEEQVADSMEVREAGDGRLAVTIELVQTNAHTCSFEGVLTPDPAAPAPARRWSFRSDDPDEGPCSLQLEQSGAEVRLLSDGCRYYCGARAVLDAVFPFPPGPPSTVPRQAE